MLQLKWIIPTVKSWDDSLNMLRNEARIMHKEAIHVQSIKSVHMSCNERQTYNTPPIPVIIYKKIMNNTQFVMYRLYRKWTKFI